MKKLLFFLLIFLAGSFADAATFTVTTDADSGTGSFREALTSANGTTGTDTIAFSAFFATARTITFASPLPAIGDDLAIIGPGSALLTISGNSQFQILNVQANRRAAISNLKFVGGKVVDSPGGAIVNAGFLLISDCSFTNNTATITPGGPSGAAFGGALWNAGNLTILRCQFSNNAASGGLISSGYFESTQPGSRGGAIYCASGSLTVESCEFSGNTAVGRGGFSSGISGAGSGSPGRGGAVFIEAGSVSVRQSSFSTNDAIGGFGGSTMGSSGRSGGSGSGGAIYLNAGMSLIEDCSFTNNRAGGGGGGAGRGSILFVPILEAPVEMEPEGPSPTAEEVGWR